MNKEKIKLTSLNEWDTEQFSRLLQLVGNKLNQHIQGSMSGEDEVADIKPLTDNLQDLNVAHFLEHGGLQDAELEDFLETYLQSSVHLHHPKYLCHQVVTPAMPSAIADLIHGAINNPVAIYEMGSTGATLEFAVINWMIEKIGWQPEPAFHSNENHFESHAAGVLTHGGSLANLTAMIAARSAIAPEAWEEGNPNDLRILVPANTHYSVARALSMMGLGRKSIVKVEVDELERIIPEKLEQSIKTIQKQNLRIMAVVVNACATSTGLFDPIDTVADICKKHKLWMHVDACHGGSLFTSNKYKHLLKGADKADSIAWDAHKLMRVSSLCAAIIVKDSKHLQNAFQQQGDYIFYGSPTAGIDLMPRTVECTKTAMGTKLFLTIAWQGEQGIREYIDGRIEMTKKFYHQINNREHFHCPYEPETNILCFRYGDDDEMQIEIRETLLNEGLFHLSSSTISGKRYLRFSVMNPYSDEDTIEELLDVIENSWRLSYSR